jgi:WD40 repeat protein
MRVFLLIICFCAAGLVVSVEARSEELRKGWAGLEAQTVTPALAGEKKLGVRHGALVSSAQSGGLQAAAGLQAGDVIIEIDGRAVQTAEDVLAVVEGLAPGARAALSAVRGQQFLTMELAAPSPTPPAAAIKAQGEPLLRLDLGGHMAKIKAVAFTPDGSQLVSASDDKTIRVWDVASGKTARVIRGEAALGDAGKIYAMALSPDGKWLAAGGSLAAFTGDNHKDIGAIRLYDFASGRLEVLLKGHENAVLGLAFSPDSQRLISGSEDRTAMIWDVAAGKALHKLEGHMDRIYAVGFTSDGARAVTGSDDHELRLWSAEDGALLKTMTGHGDKVRSLAVSFEDRIASGDRSGEICLWDGRTGAFIKMLAKQETTVGALSFSPDGKTLLSTCGYGPCASHPQIIYDAASGREITTYREHDNIVIAAAISPDRRWAATGGGNNNEIHIWDSRTGARRQGPDERPLILDGSGRRVWAVGFSADSRQIAWGNSWMQFDPTNGYGPLQRTLTLPSGQAAPSGPRELDAETVKFFLRAETRRGDYSISHRKGGDYGFDAILDVKQGGKVRVSIEREATDGYQHRAYSFSPDGETIISGGSFGVLAAYDLNGKKLGEFVGHEGDVLAVASSPDGRYLVSGAADQTVRLWNLKTRELLVTLFEGSDDEWVMWTPQGFYAASPGGAKLIAWQVNKGPEHAACAVSGEQLYKRLNRPRLLARAIELASAEAAIQESPEERGFKLADLLQDCAPSLRLAGVDHASGRGRATLTLAFEPNALPGRSVDIYAGERKLDWTPVTTPRPRSEDGLELRAYDIPLAHGQNELRIVARNVAGDGAPLRHYLFHRGEGDLDQRGVLRLLAVGVDRYPQAGAKYDDLRFAAADARAFARIAQERIGPRYAAVEATVLTSGEGSEHEPTRARIEAALKTLAMASGKDAVVVFLAGHGERRGDHYFFLPTDVAKGSGDGPGEGGNLLDWETIQGSLTTAGGRRVLFVDTCRPGGAYNMRLVSDAFRENFVAFTATQDDNPSFEKDGHGYFTRAVVEGLGGAAEDRDHAIKVFRFGDYLDEEVQRLSDGKQKPKFNLGPENFILAKRKD